MVSAEGNRNKWGVHIMNGNLKIAKAILAVARQLVASDNEEMVEQWVKIFEKRHLSVDNTKSMPTVAGMYLWIILGKDGGYCYWSSSDSRCPSWNRDAYRSTTFPKFDMPLSEYREKLAEMFKSLKNDVDSFFKRFRDYPQHEKNVKKVCDWLDSLADAALKEKYDFKIGDSLDGLKCVDNEYESHEKKGDLKQWLSQYHWTKFLPKGADSKYGRLWVDWEKKVYRSHCTIDEFYGGGVVD